MTSNPDPPLPVVEFFFTPEGAGATLPVGTDRTGMVQDFGPVCVTPSCTIPGVYSLPVGVFGAFPTGWGRLSARILGHLTDDAFVRVFLHLPMITDAASHAAHISTSGRAGEHGSGSSQSRKRRISPASAQGGSWRNRPAIVTSTATNSTWWARLSRPTAPAPASPTAIGANLAWLNDTSQWLTIPASITNVCSGSRRGQAAWPR